MHLFSVLCHSEHCHSEQMSDLHRFSSYQVFCVNKYADCGFFDSLLTKHTNSRSSTLLEISDFSETHFYIFKGKWLNKCVISASYPDLIYFFIYFIFFLEITLICQYEGIQFVCLFIYNSNWLEHLERIFYHTGLSRWC